MKLKDRHEWSARGNFTKIYPSEHLHKTERYDNFILKSVNLFRERFGINIMRGSKRSKEILKEEDTVAWNEQPSHYNNSKIEKVYGGASNFSFLNSRTAKSSTHKKRLIFL